jgi:hypothetical protein
MGAKMRPALPWRGIYQRSFMKLTLLLLALLLKMPATAPALVRVTFSPLTKAAYLDARKLTVITKPTLTFPVKKVRGRLVVPTAAGPKVFQDKGMGTDNDDQAQYEYAGYLPQFGYHVVIGHLWERTNWLLLGPGNAPLQLYDAPVYSPDLKRFVVSAAGIEYGVYPNEIRLFQFDKGCWRQVWQVKPSVEPATWEPQEIRWLSNSTLLLKKRMWTGKNPGSTYAYAKLTIQ